jgi:hypothetical protein
MSKNDFYFTMYCRGLGNYWRSEDNNVSMSKFKRVYLELKGRLLMFLFKNWKLNELPKWVDK